MTDQVAPVVSIGEILIDLIVTGEARSLEVAETLAVRPGGAPANAAVATRRFGLPVRFCGVVGDDPFGVRLRQTLTAQDVDDRALRTQTGAQTTLAFAWKDDRGDGHFRLQRDADQQIATSDVETAGVADASALILGTVSLSSEPARTAILYAAQTAKAAGVPIVVDPNIRPAIWPNRADMVAATMPLLESATLLKLSVDDARALFGLEDPQGIFTALERFPASHVVLTDGARGAWFRSASGAVEHVPAFPVSVVDPTGAGDAFTGALVSRLVRNGWQPLTRADVRFAAAAGAITASQAGGIDSLPDTAAVEAFLATQPDGQG